MDKDTFVPQSGGGGHVKEGHDESDLSIKGIVTFGVILAIAGLLTFVGVRVLMTDVPVLGLAWWEQKIFPQPPLTPVEKKLQDERDGTGRAKAAHKEGEAESRPEWFGRGDVEARLNNTFPTPRLQYDDVRDMQMFRGSEEEWLESSGKDAQGNIHIPIDRAMDLIAKNGLPPVSGPFVPPTLPTAVPMVPAPAASRK
jgi:hypothetical protein